MSTNTVKLHRVLRATPDRVYRAFLDAGSSARFQECEFVVDIFYLEAEIPQAIHTGSVIR